MPRVGPEEIARIATESTGSRGLAAATGVSKDDAAVIQRVCKMSVDEFAEHHRANLQRLADKLQAKAQTEVDALTPMQTVISLGITTDKLNQGPRAVNQSVHLHIKGDAASALTSILGPAAQSVFRTPQLQDSKAPNYKGPNHSLPVIDILPDPIPSPRPIVDA